jgi:hypothetical protein
LSHMKRCLACPDNKCAAVPFREFSMTVCRHKALLPPCIALGD